MLPCLANLLWQGFAGGDAGAQIAAGVSLSRREHRGIEGRDAEIERWPVLLHQPEHGLRRWSLGPQDGRAADAQREGHAVAEAVGKKQLGRREEHVLFADAQHWFGIDAAGFHRRGVQVLGALRHAGGARGIEPEGDLVRHSVRNRKVGGLSPAQSTIVAAIADHDCMGQLRQTFQDRFDHRQKGL